MSKRPFSQLNTASGVNLRLLSSIMELGSGIFIGVGIAVEVAQGRAWIALTAAALVSLNNRWSEAQVLTSPDAGFNLLLMQPAWLQFIVDWTLFLAQLTLAAAIALAGAGYLLIAIQGLDPIWLVPIALFLLGGLTAVVAQPRSRHSLLQLTKRSMSLAISFAILALLGFFLAGLLNLRSIQMEAATTPLPTLLQATALMSIAYISPSSVPTRAVQTQRHLIAVGMITVLAGLIYLGITVIGFQAVGSAMARTITAYAAPLAVMTQHLLLPGGLYLIAIGAVTVLSVQLMLSLPRFADRLLALNQPSPFSVWKTSATRSTLPRSATVSVSVLIGCILLIGDLTTLWSFSAAASLLYFALIHWIALHRSSPVQLYRRSLNSIGLGLCLFLVFWVEWSVWLVTLGLISLGLIWYGMMRWSDQSDQQE